MTASVTFSPRYASASDFSFCRIMALISGGLKVLPLARVTTTPSDLGSFSTWYGTRSFECLTSGSSNRRPMKRLMLKMVFSGLVIACRLATWPTSRSPLLAKATTDGVMRPPSALVMTCGSPPSLTPTTELVVPRSMPMIFPMLSVLLRVVRDADERWAQDTVTEPVSALKLTDHLVVGVVCGLLVDDRLVEVRIKWLAERLDLPDALGLEQASQLSLHEAHAVDPRLVRALRHRLQSAVEVVEHAQQLADQQRVAELRQALAVLVDPAPVVGEVGGGPLQTTQVLVGLLACRFQHALHVLELLDQVGT